MQDDREMGISSPLEFWSVSVDTNRASVTLGVGREFVYMHQVFPDGKRNFKRCLRFMSKLI